MSHFSDKYHMDRCAGNNCNFLDFRSSMVRIEGRRGYFCTWCAPRYQAMTDRKNAREQRKGEQLSLFDPDAKD